MTQGCNAANVIYISKLMPANATHILTGNIQYANVTASATENTSANATAYATTTNTTDNATANAIAIS